MPWHRQSACFLRASVASVCVCVRETRARLAAEQTRSLRSNPKHTAPRTHTPEKACREPRKAQIIPVDISQRCGSGLCHNYLSMQTKKLDESEGVNQRTHTHARPRVEIRGRRCWHSNSQKGFVPALLPTDKRKHTVLMGTNVINMPSACSAVYCTEDAAPRR